MAQSYLATFFSHYDAVQFGNAAKQKGIAVKLMPVPRKLSSSCGTGALWEGEAETLDALMGEGVDKVFLIEDSSHRLVFDSGSGS